MSVLFPTGLISEISKNTTPAMQTLSLPAQTTLESSVFLVPGKFFKIIADLGNSGSRNISLQWCLENGQNSSVPGSLIENIITGTGRKSYTLKSISPKFKLIAENTHTSERPFSFVCLSHDLLTLTGEDLIHLDFRSQTLDIGNSEDLINTAQPTIIDRFIFSVNTGAFFIDIRAKDKDLNEFATYRQISSETNQPNLTVMQLLASQQMCDPIVILDYSDPTGKFSGHLDCPLVFPNGVRIAVTNRSDFGDTPATYSIMGFYRIF